MASNRFTAWRAVMPAILVLLLALLWSAYWLWLFDMAQRRTDTELQRLAGQGLALTCAGRDWGGYPFRIEATCERPDFIDSRGGAIAQAKAESLLVVMQAYDFRKVAALLDGPTVITPRDGTPLTITHDRILAAFHRLSAADHRLSIEIPNLRIDEDVSAVIANLHFRARDETVLDIAASGDGISIVADDAKFTIDKAALEANMPLTLVKTGEPLRAMAASGDKLTVTRASLTRGGLVISADGSLTVTPQGHVDGRLRTVINDLELLIAVLRESLPLNEREIAQLRALGGVLAGATGNRSISVDLVFKDGDVYWSAFKIGEIAPLF